MRSTRVVPHRIAGIVLFAAAAALAAVTPTGPYGSDVFRVGGDCTTTWTLDTTGTWDSFAIDLMSGGNLDMVVLTRVADNMDGTSGEGTYTFPCPAVTPHSAIYFLQFTQGGADPQWTTRFTIAGRNGDTVAPEFSTQSNGDAIPWGNGALADGTQPSSVSGAMSASGSASVSASASGSGSATMSASSGMITSTVSSSSAIPTLPPGYSSRSSSSVASSDSQSSGTESDSSSSARPSSSAVAAVAASSMFYDSWSLGAKIGLLAGVIVGGVLVLVLLVWLLVRCCRRRRNSSSDNVNLLGASTNSRERDYNNGHQHNDDAFDFRDEADSSYLKNVDANDSYANLHEKHGYHDDSMMRDDYNEKPATAITTNAYVPSENRAGMGSGAARKLYAARQASAANKMPAGTAPPIGYASSTPHRDYRSESPVNARGVGEAYPLVPMASNGSSGGGAARTPSPANAYGYADLVPKTSPDLAPPVGYQWSANVRNEQLEQQSDWLRSRQGGAR